jgi:hypothetical protein
MRTDDDGATRLEGDEDFVDCGGCRVGRRHDGGDHAKRLGDFDHAPIFVAGNHPHGLHRLDKGVDLLGGEQVFLNLVGDDPEAGFFHGETREGLCLGHCGGGDGVNDGIDLFLAELGQFEPGLPGPTGQSARFRDGGEIAVRRGRGGRTSAHFGRMRSTSV